MAKPPFVVRPSPLLKGRPQELKEAAFPSVEAIIQNALDFLRSATRDLEKHPKQSVIAFYTAVELFLKARLMQEHWSLVVTKDADRDKFAAGDFVSVSFEDACKRLDKVIGAPLSKATFEAFDRVRKHRNKMVHFYHEGAMADEGLEAIALEQLSAWLALRDLLTHQWRDALKVGSKLDLISLNQRFSKHRQYYQAKWLRVQEELAQIKRDGGRVDLCSRCEREAAEILEDPRHLFQASCRVCHLVRTWYVGACPNCSSPMEMGGESSICTDCFHTFTAQQLAVAVDESTAATPIDQKTPANCAECNEHHTVFETADRYICMGCLTDFDELHMCEWCEEFSTEDMSGSYIKGCGQCRGAAG